MNSHASKESGSLSHVIDTDVFLNFWKIDNDEPFGKDVHKSAWEYLEKQIKQGRIIAPIWVKEELIKHGSADLIEWVTLNEAMFIELDSGTIASLKAIVKLHPVYKKTRSSKADAAVVALAKSRGLTVITSEKKEPAGSRSSNNPKIPNVCEDLNVKCVSATGFFRSEGISF